jgi:hypothetical protein
MNYKDTIVFFNNSYILMFYAIQSNAVPLQAMWVASGSGAVAPTQS